MHDVENDKSMLLTRWRFHGAKVTFDRLRLDVATRDLVTCHTYSLISLSVASQYQSWWNIEAVSRIIASIAKQSDEGSTRSVVAWLSRDGGDTC